MSHKVCSKCGDDKPLSEFYRYKSGRRKGEIKARCIECTLEYNKLYNKVYRSKPAFKAKKKRDRAKRKARLDKMKRDVGCVVCGESCPSCLDYHHRDPKKKSGGLGKYIEGEWSLKSARLEIKKCEVVCSNCHRKYDAGKLPEADAAKLRARNPLKNKP